MKPKPKKRPLRKATFADALKARRAALGFTTTQLAARLTAAGIAVSGRTVEDWEQGRRTPEPFKQSEIFKRL